jgi:hypothetical protein
LMDPRLSAIKATFAVAGGEDAAGTRHRSVSQRSRSESVRSHESHHSETRSRSGSYRH